MRVRVAILLWPPSRGDTTEAGLSSFPADCIRLEGPAHPPPRLTASGFLEVAREAKVRGATHLGILPRWAASPPGRLEPLAAACRAHPHALVIGCRPPHPAGGFGHRWRERILPRFWLKMQTGRHLKDPASPLRSYPLDLIDHLRLFQRGKPLETEILVKSAWADATLVEVPVDTDPAVCRPTAPPPRQPIWHLILNIHFTLRSVLPLPHRKLVADGNRPSKRISVWRPMRSLRRLLSENASPIQLALAAAAGVFLGTLPLIACHTLAIILAANYFRLNKVAALSASQLCMPPVVPALCIEIGYWLRHGRLLTEISLETLGYQALERLYEWLLGALVLAPLLAFLIGGLTFLLAHVAARKMAAVRPFKQAANNGVEP